MAAKVSGAHKTLVLGVATVGGVGFLPLAPGTWGSLAALLLWRPLASLGPWWYGLAVGVVLAAALLVAGPAQAYLGRTDHQAIVVDEVVGLWITLAGMPVSWFWAGAGFLVFRVLDIVKPWPIRWFSDGRGGLEVVADDVVAGIMARLILEGVFSFWFSVFM